MLRAATHAGNAAASTDTSPAPPPSASVASSSPDVECAHGMLHRREDAGAAVSFPYRCCRCRISSIAAVRFPRRLTQQHPRCAWLIVAAAAIVGWIGLMRLMHSGTIDAPAWTSAFSYSSDASRAAQMLPPALSSSDAEASAVSLYRALQAASPDATDAITWGVISEAMGAEAKAEVSARSSAGTMHPAAASTPVPFVRFSPPALRVVSPRHCVLILVSWSASQCAQARVTWRSVRRLDPRRTKDVMFAMQHSQDDGDEIASDDADAQHDEDEEQTQEEGKRRSAATSDPPQDRVSLDPLFRAFRRSSRGAARIPECESLVQLVRHEAQLQLQSLQRLHEIRMQLDAVSASASSSHGGSVDPSRLPPALVAEVSEIGLGRTAFAFFDAVAVPPKAHIRFAAWYFALHKLQLFAVGLEPTAPQTHKRPNRFIRMIDGVAREESFPPVWRGRYERALLLDSDIVLVHSLERYFPAPLRRSPAHALSQPGDASASASALFPLFLSARGIDSPSDLAGVHEQSAHCSRAHKMNGGLLSFRPSRSLHSAALRTLALSPGGGCEDQGKELQEAEQSVINCMCGFTGGPAIRRAEEEEKGSNDAATIPRDQFSPKLRAADIRCELLPSSASVFSGAGDVDSRSTTPPCALPPAEDVTALHFTWKPKPHEWGTQQQWRECRAHRQDKEKTTAQKGQKARSSNLINGAGSTAADVADPSPSSKPSRCYEGTAAMFTFWHCLAGSSDQADEPFDPTLMQQHCAYSPLDTV